MPCFGTQFHIRFFQRAIMMDSPDRFEPFDAAMIVRGLAATPSERLGRRSLVDAILTALDSFPTTVQLLGRRPRGRTGIAVQDEYDVQWLLHALLSPFIPDLVPEDPAPSLAGSSSRLDFTSNKAKLGIEVKYLRKQSDTSRMREELMVDERHYQEHPYVDTVVAFVYDPENHVALSKRTAFERDLSGPVTVGGRTVTYLTRVR
jgi:hypothetical protein